MSLSLKGTAIIAIVLVGAGLVSLLALGLLNKASVTERSGITRVQKPAPEFTLPLLNGGRLEMARLRGQPVVINFWASWCPPCRLEAGLLERAWRSYKDQGVMFVGVDIQDTEAEGVAYVEEFDITYPNGLDAEGTITVDYGVIGLPVTFFVNRDGTVERRWVGAIYEARLVTWLDELVAGVALSGQEEGENLEGFFKLDQGD